MAQGLLPFKIERTEESNGLTSLAGLPGYLEYYRSISLAGIWPFLLHDDGRLN
jgi:hypothetical protein